MAEETTLDAHLRDLTAAQRISAMAAVSLAVLGIVLLAAGCASLFVWMVRESVREIAVRMILGATGATVARRILARAVVLTGAGLLAGACGAYAAAAYTADRLYEVSVWDPAAWLLAIALILGVALASAWSAAVLAARVDPAGLLRSE